MLGDGGRETECLRDALPGAFRVAAGRIGADVDAIESTRLSNFRFDPRRRELVLRAREESLRIGKICKRAKLHGIAAADAGQRRGVRILGLSHFEGRGERWCDGRCGRDWREGW